MSSSAGVHFTRALIGAGLFVRTLDNLRKVDLGFTTENVVMFGVSPATRDEPDRKLQVYRTLMESLATVPGVSAVGANSSRLLTGGRWDSQITLQGRPAPADGSVPWSFFNAVTPGTSRHWASRSPRAATSPGTIGAELAGWRS